MVERVQRISYFPLTEMDGEMMAVMDRDYRQHGLGLLSAG